jgi:hypothetical protein
LTRTVSFINTSATRACSTGVLGINQEHRDPGYLRFVGDKLPELVEPPVVEPSPLLPPGLDSTTDSPQVFKGYRAAVAFGGLNNSLADYMVHIFLKSFLFSPEKMELALSRFTAILLEILAAVKMRVPDFLNCFTRITIGVGIKSQIDHAQINAQNVLKHDGIGFVHVTHAGHIPFSTHKHEIAFPALGLQKLALPGPTGKWHYLPSTQAPNRNSAIPFYLENPVIVGLRRMLFEFADRLFAPDFVGIRDFAQTTHRNLRRQLIPFFDIIVAQAMKFKLAQGAILEPCFTDFITSLVANFQGFLKNLGLMEIWKQLDVCDYFHISIVE